MDLTKLIVMIFIFVEISEACNCRSYREFDDLWMHYKKMYRKHYCRVDNAKRRKIWNKALHRVIKHNLEFDLGIYKFRRGLNKYSDLTHDEFVSKFNGFKGTPESRKNKNNRTRNYSQGILSAAQLPKRLDYREINLVTPVKDQGSCGSCWAFSALASLEGQIMKSTTEKINLSVQNLVDCSFSYGNKGCQGGLMTQAFDYIIENEGVESESTYPYKARRGKCRFDKSNVAATCRYYKEIEPGNEDALLEALVRVGPISVGIDASLESFMDCKGGIYDDSSCNSENLDHAVLAIGYGTEDGVDYWIIKNSYGISWGENGYARIARNNNNQCGIATQACYPVV